MEAAVYGWLVMAIFFLIWLIFMLAYPARWEAIVDKENGYWVSKGFIKESTAEKIKGFEKGLFLKILCAFVVVVSLLNAKVFSGL